LASIDFIRPNEEFYTFFDIDVNVAFNKKPKFSDVEYVVRHNLKTFAWQKHIFVSKADKDKIVEDLLYSAFIRMFLLGDNDVRSGNFGILFNKKTKKVRLAPNFDFDATFKDHNYCLDSLRYLFDNYPRVYEKLIKKFKELLNVDEKTRLSALDMIFASAINNELILDNLLVIINSNIINMNRAIFKIESEQGLSK